MADILVVDDRSKDLEDLKWAAKGAGRTVVPAKNREQALDLISKNDFDVVVTDLELIPGDPKSGLDVLNAAKEKDPYTQVIVVTGGGDPELSVRAMALGAYDYIQRGALGVNVPAMVRIKITKALEFRDAVLRSKAMTADQP